MKFVLDLAETPGERVARVAREALAPGPMGAYLRGSDYGDFLDIWGDGERLRFVKTSCAVFASAVLGYAGYSLRKPWHADGSWGITSWLGLGFEHPAWVASSDADPLPGDVFYRGSTTASNGHVGIFVKQCLDGYWITAEGGGVVHAEEMEELSTYQIKATNGTVCRLSTPLGKDVWALDSLGRHLTGWWRAEMLGLPTTEEILTGLRDQ